MKWLVFILAVWTAPLMACEDALQRQRMIEYLSQDQEFTEFVCGTEPCGTEKLSARVEIRSEIVRHKPKAVGCFVEPIRKARNFYTGVFLILDSQDPKPQFIFFGSGIGSTKKVLRGLKVIEGHEIGELGKKEIHIFRWNGKAYVERQ